jgi:transglutaminase-like putative cysteine protease
VNAAALPVRARGWVIAAVGLVILPHLPRLPWWLALFAVAAGVSSLLMLRRPGSHNPPRSLLLLLTVAASAGIYLHYGTLLGKTAGVALLVVMLVLKLLELNTRRDARLAIYLCYFLVITNFLYTQTPLVAVYMFLATVVITAALTVTTHAGRPAYQHLRLAMVLLAQALPIMVVLFVFFPRIAGPIWGLPKDAYAGLSGISDRMTPGTLSSLALSDAPAFRVRFSGAAPAPALRYWRGPVLWYTDGRTWMPGRFELNPHDPPPVVQHEGEPVRQSITLEGHNRRWLFALDLPGKISLSAIRTPDFQWQAYKPVRERIHYTAISWTDYTTGEPDPRRKAAALQLPAAIGERVRTLAGEWRRQAHNDRAVVQQALAYFHDNPFVYTLQPPLLGEDPVNEFLFTTRRGFCEHFASAFVVLMRSAGIPARVVTGYQGGEYNPVGDYWLVRQSDAHAWAEVWLLDAGWERVDPTAAVAPERIEHALDPGAQSAGGAARFKVPESALLARSLRNLHHTLDAMNMYWNEWILAYGPQLQLEFLAALGFGVADWRKMALALLVLTSALLLGIALWMLARQPAPADPLLRAWRTYCLRLARLGIRRQSSEGPLDFSRRTIAARPELAAQVEAITDLYIRLRYGNPENPAPGIALLRRLVRRFPRAGGQSA